MTREETKKLLYVISNTYSNFKPASMKDTIDAWAFMLSEYSYQDIAVALKTWVASSGSAFAPSISELIAMSKKPESLAQISELEAWTMVRTAISRSTYHSVEEFEKLPPIVQEAVGTAQQLYYWATSDLEAIETVVASNFQRTFRAKVKQKEQIDALPMEAREKLASLQRVALRLGGE